MLFKTVECPSMLLVAHKVGGFSLLSLLFGVVSGLFQPVLACLESFHLSQATTLQKVFSWKFTINKLSFRFYYKVGQVLLQR